MTLRAQANYDSGATRLRVRQLLDRAEVLAREKVVDAKSVSNLVDEYRDLIEHLGLPTFNPLPLDRRETATFQRLNEIFSSLGADIDALYAELRSLNAMMTQHFNFTQAALAGTTADMNLTTALVLITALSVNLPQRGQFVAVDSFADQSKMDAEHSTAEVGFGGGALTLQRTSVQSVIDAGTQVDVSADAKPIATKFPVTVKPPYEGKYYALLGEALPEAGRLKFIDSKPDKSGKVTKSVAVTPLDELRKARRVVLDGAQDTYWQIERVLIHEKDEEVDPGQLDQDVKYDFEVEFVVKLANPKQISAVTMDPMNFGERSWLEVLDISTSMDNQNWESIPGLHDHSFYNVLTDEANQQINSRLANAVLAPSKYSYAGRGLWVFPTRELRFLRIRLIQRAPILAPYEVLVIKQSQQVQTSKTSASFLGFGGKKSTKTKTEYRDIVLSYEDSLATFMGQFETPEGKPSVDANQGINIDIPGVGNVFSSGGKTVSKSGWQYQSGRTEQRLNAVRYAIGLRELELLSANYSQESTYVSKPFVIPADIRQIQLRSDHTIPADFGPGDWIRYFVSADDGKTWTRIAPIDFAPQYVDGDRVPTAILVNASIPIESQDNRFGYVETNGPARNLLVRIDLSRPESTEGATPIVKRYALDVLTQETIQPVTV